MGEARARLYAFAFVAAVIAVAGTAPLWARHQEARSSRTVKAMRARADRWASSWRARRDAEASAARWEDLATELLNGVIVDDNGFYPPVNVYDLLAREPNPPGTVILEVGPGRYQFIDEYAVLTPAERARVLTRDEMVGAYLAWDAKWRRTQLEPPWRRCIAGGRPKPPPAPPAAGEEVPPPGLERSPAKEVCIPEPEPAGTAEGNDVEPGES